MDEITDVHEGDSLDGEEQTPAESSPENNTGEADPSSEGGNTQDVKPLPFGEDPKIQDYLDRQWESRERALREQLQAEFEEKIQSIKQPSSSSDGIPPEAQPWFAGDEESWRAFDSYLSQRDERVSQAAYERFKQDQQQQEKTVQEANQWLEDSVKQIETEENRALTPQERQQLFQSCLENELIDTKGRWNYRAGWRILKAQASAGGNPSVDDQSLNDRKNLANITTRSDKSKETSGKIVRTSEDFSNPENRPW